ncbi:carboxypeptidase-like regulatory domain-containing protein [Winogradskyella ludwigii]|uniref:carboxypeptidase-like regulatory domain-containing protein n=1 Tax=Winogradskyella ludwigii TaxID=2686076 RepID=UPI0015CA02D3|nr:carboxypeptidase-like regulatory domain-containing protein [Winogradskyella ludwigii]
MRFFNLIIVFVVFSVFASSAQEKSELLFRILNVESKQPIPYVTIQFAHNKNGTISNALGDFRIPMRYKVESDSLIISCIGYSTKRVSLAGLPEKSFHTIYLIPKTEALNEVVINANDKKKLLARQIVQKAIDNIKNNYPVEPFSYMAYYRDYQFADEEYINLNEGIIEVFDQGFLTQKISNPSNRTALYSYKLNTEFIQDSLLSNSVYNKSKQINDGKMGSSIGNELTLLNIHNPIRNFNISSFSFVYILEKDFIVNHNFYNKGIIFLDNEELYKIEFSAKRDITRYAYKANGFIYISKDDFSIHRFDYNLFSNSPRKLILALNIEYKRQENDKMYLNYITFNNNFFITQNDALKVESSLYDKNISAFIIKFNRTLDRSSIEKISNVKISFQDKKLPIYSLNLIDSKTVEVKFNKEISGFLNKQNRVDEALFSFKLKNFKDVRGFKMKKSKVEGYQFRELFVQRVFLDKMLSSTLLYAEKALSLKHAPINDLKTEDYWLNSPLKQMNENIPD